MRRFSIQIPQPCSERWADMQPTERGRFCAHCQKTVVDYTHLSDPELARLFRQPTQGVCGRFRNDQLNRALTAPDPVKAPVWRHWLRLMTLGLFSWQTVRAQVAPSTPPAQPVSAHQSTEPIPLLPLRKLTVSEVQWVIDGRVLFQDSSGSVSPLPGTVVFVNRSGGQWKTLTDSAGRFRLAVSTQVRSTDAVENTKLVVSIWAPHHIPKQVAIDATPSEPAIALHDVILSEPPPPQTITGGEVVVIQAPSRWQKLKRSLFRRSGGD